MKEGKMSGYRRPDVSYIPGTSSADTTRTRPPKWGGNKALVFACFMAGAAGSLMGHGFLAAPEPVKVPVYPSFSLPAGGYLYEPQTTNYRLNDSGLYLDPPVNNVRIWTREVGADDYLPVEWDNLPLSGVVEADRFAEEFYYGVSELRCFE